MVQNFWQAMYMANNQLAIRDCFGPASSHPTEDQIRSEHSIVISRKQTTSISPSVLVSVVAFLKNERIAIRHAGPPNTNAGKRYEKSIESMTGHRLTIAYVDVEFNQAAPKRLNNFSMYSPLSLSPRLISAILDELLGHSTRR